MKKYKLFLLGFIFLISFTLSVDAARVHRVSIGDTLYSIAEEYQVTVEEIINLNNLENPQKIFDRQVLIISPVNPYGAYRVQQGDTLFQISQNLGIPINNLVEANHLNNQNVIYNKQLLNIPSRFRYPQLYEVKANDSIFKIAKEFNITTEEIILFNKLENHNIEVNQTLKIPVSKAQPPSNEPARPNYRRMFPDTLFYRGLTNNRKIALTFDDGPDSYYTEKIMEILSQYDIQATFFIVGDLVGKYPDVIEKMAKDGHVIANHTWSHSDLSSLSQEEIIAEIKDTEDIVEEITGLSMRFLRPPWGFVSEDVLTIAQELDYRVVNWNVDSIDWNTHDVDQILINLLPNVRNDSILLFHSAGGRDQNLDATVDVLPELIETLKIYDYSFVTVDEILKTPAYQS